MKYKDPFGDCYDFDIFYEDYYWNFPPQIELEEGDDGQCLVSIELEREFGKCLTNEKSGFYLILSSDSELATSYSKGIHCY